VALVVWFTWVIECVLYDFHVLNIFIYFAQLTQFYHARDIPTSFIRSQVRLRGRVQSVMEDGRIRVTVCHSVFMFICV
jgi:hypothetical protein